MRNHLAARLCAATFCGVVCIPSSGRPSDTDGVRVHHGAVILDAKGKPQAVRVDLQLSLTSYPVVQSVILSTTPASAGPWTNEQLTRDSRGYYPAILSYGEQVRYYLVVVTETGKRITICSEAVPCAWDTSAYERVRVGDKNSSKKLRGGGLAALLVVLGAVAGGPGSDPEEAAGTSSTSYTPSIAGAWVGTGADGISYASAAAEACRGRAGLALTIVQNSATANGTYRMEVSEGNCVPVGTVFAGNLSGGVNAAGEVSFVLDGALSLVGSVSGSRLAGTASGSLPGQPGVGIAGTWSVTR